MASSTDEQRVQKRPRGTAGAALSPTDDDDRVLFASLEESKLNKILLIKSNDPDVAGEEITLSIDDREGKMAGRLGQIIGQAMHLKRFFLFDMNVNLPEFCVGLQINQSIQRLSLHRVNLGGGAFMCLDSFLRSNRSLRSITLACCNIDATALELLSDALFGRPADRLECLGLLQNGFGDCNMDKFVLALQRQLNHLDLECNGIGRRGCASIAKLLRSQHCPRSLQLGGNSIDDDDVALLVRSLARNVHLRELGLAGNSAITTLGWSAVLNLVCDSTSIGSVVASNHTLHDVIGRSYILGILPDQIERAIERALGTDDANLIRASLKINDQGRTQFIIRRKILWCHARGNFNIGATTLVTCALPRVLAWIGGAPNEVTSHPYLRTLMAIWGHDDTANYLLYHDPPLPAERVGAIRLDSFYRIVRARPDLCGRTNPLSVGA